jgi:hypothetical protein
MGTRCSFPGKLTTHLHLVPRSRMHGAILPFPQYAFMAWCSIKSQGQLYLFCFAFASYLRNIKLVLNFVHFFYSSAGRVPCFLPDKIVLSFGTQYAVESNTHFIRNSRSLINFAPKFISESEIRLANCVCLYPDGHNCYRLKFCMNIMLTTFRLFMTPCYQ